MKTITLLFRSATSILPACLLLAALAVGKVGAAEANVPAPSPPATNAPAWLTQPMSLVDAMNIALQQNASILKGQRDLEAAYGVVVQTKAVALPKLLGDAGYTHDEAVEEFPFPVNLPKDKWTGNIRITQSIYEGGRITSALRAARLTQEQALLQYQAVEADVLLDVRTVYYNVLLAEQEIIVQKASTNLLTRQLEDTTRRYEAGTVPRFNVLRAEVELANARPRLFRAENAYVITKNNLVNVLGYNLPTNIWEDIPLQLTGKLEAEPYEIDLPSAIARALRNRPELGALRRGEKLRKEDIVQAKSVTRPSVQLFGGYGARNNSFTDDFFQDVSGANAGVQLSWALWDGNLTKGRVMQAKALHERSLVELDDASRGIELEVRTAYSSFLEARKVLVSLEKVLEQAEEALRLANSRYDAGTGTQLDVLSAQTSLTDARSTNVRALREYSVALARLQRAVGWDVVKEPGDERLQRK